MLVMVQEKMALCTLTWFSDGAAVLLIGTRQHGGPMPDHAPDAQITFESGPNLVMLNGILDRRGEDQVLFRVTDGVQVPPRRRDSRLRTRLPVRLRLPSGEEREGSRPTSAPPGSAWRATTTPGRASSWACGSPCPTARRSWPRAWCASPAP